MSTGRSRLEPFLRELVNYGLRPEDADAFVTTAEAYLASRRAPPDRLEQLRLFARETAKGDVAQEERTEMMLHAWVVWERRDQRVDPSSLVRGIITLDAEGALEFAQDSLEGKAAGGRLARSAMSEERMELIAKVVAPIAAAAVFLFALVANPIFDMFAPSVPEVALVSDMPAVDMPAHERQWQVGFAQELVRRANGKGIAPVSIDAMLEVVQEGERSKFEPVSMNWEVDRSVKPADHSVVLRRRDGGPGIIVVAPHGSVLVDENGTARSGGFER